MKFDKKLALGLALLAGAISCSNPPQTAQKSNPEIPKAESAPVYFKVDEGTASTVSGQILFTGKRPPLKKVDFEEDPACAQLHPKTFFDQTLVVRRDGRLANAFVYIKNGLDGKKFEPPSTPVTIDQKGCWFEPRVLGIQTGQELKVTNSDPVTHNIHPRAQINREWNHSQGSGEPPIERRFLKQEVMIRVKCNVHSWMHAFIGVVDSPYFAVTGTDGAFELKDVPPGTYTIEAWQESLGTLEQTITVAPKSKQNLTFDFKDHP